VRAQLARWRGRVGGGVVLAGVGYAIAVWLDFEPRPLPYVVWAVVVLAMTYLVIDTVDAQRIPTGRVRTRARRGG